LIEHVYARITHCSFSTGYRLTRAQFADDVDQQRVSQLFGVEQSDVEMQWDEDGNTKNAAVIAFRSKDAAQIAHGELKLLHVPSSVHITGL
jgi:hypothetical protein